MKKGKHFGFFFLLNALHQPLLQLFSRFYKKLYDEKRDHCEDKTE